MPYKSWCPVCVKNAAQNYPHNKIKGSHFRDCASFSMDYMYMTSKPSEKEITHPILVIKERSSDGIWALPVIRKGTFKNNIVQRILKIIDSV